MVILCVLCAMCYWYVWGMYGDMLMCLIIDECVRCVLFVCLLSFYFVPLLAKCTLAL